MTDREQVIALLENADIEYEDWNERLLTADNGNVEFHFDSEGKLNEVVGAAW
jgi:hypothetical protein